LESVNQFELTKEFLERFGEAIEVKDHQFIQEILDGVNPADISALLHEFNREDSKYVLGLLDVERGAEIINGLDDDIRIQFLNEFESNEISISFRIRET